MTVPAKKVSLAEIPARWLHDVRQAVVDNGQPLRAHFTLPIIEAKSLRTNAWMPLMMFSSCVEFETIDDRNAVLKMLTGVDPLPALPEPTT
jgi:hypothetical protein